MVRLVPEGVGRARSHVRRFPRAFWILAGGDAFESFGFGLVLPFVALYLTDTIGASAAEAGVALALWSLVALGATPLGGVLSDRLGRRPVMLAGLGGSALAAIGFGLVSSLWWVAALVVVWGLFSSIFDPAAQAYVADVVAPDLRTEAFGLLRVVSNGAFAFGPPVGALLIWVVSIRAVFVLAGLASLVYLLVVWRALPESRPGREEGEPTPQFRAALRDRLLVVVAVGVGLAAVPYAFYEGVVPVFLHEERGLAVATWGLLFGITALLVVVLQYPLARWAGRRSSRAMLALGALLQGGSLLILLPATNAGLVVLALVVLTFGEMLVVPISQAVAAELAPSRLRGSYQGALNLAWELAFGPATIMGLWLLGRGHGETVLAAALPLAALAALLFFALPSGRLRREPEVAELPIAP